MKFVFFILFSSLCFWSPLKAQDVEPQISVGLSQNQIRPNDPFQLTVSVKIAGDEDVAVSEPRWKKSPAIENRGMQSQTGAESRLQPGPHGMEFTRSKSYTFIYQLVVKKEGSYSLGPFDIQVGEKNYSGNAIPLEVTTKAAPQEVRRRGIFPPGLLDEEDENLFGHLLRNQMMPQEEPTIPSRQLPVNEKEAFFMTLETDKTEVYEGEQVFASWYIYTRGNIHQFDRLKFPELKGFWKEDVEPAPILNFAKEMVNGVLFHRALLASYAVFPMKAGDSIIDEYKIRATISLPNAFGGFGFGQPMTYTKVSRPLNIKVKPLPTEGRPDYFMGGVGQFQVRAFIDQQKFVQGQPLTLKLRFEGDGNAKLIDLPKLSLPSNLELYDSKSESRFFQSGKSYKEFHLLVIPKESGVIKIPQFKFSYFDPQKGTFEDIETQEVALQVMAGEKLKEDSARLQLDKSSTAPLIKRVIPAPRRTEETPSIHWVYGLPMLFVWAGLYSVLFLGFILWNWLWLKKLYRSRTLWDELYDRRRDCVKALDQKNLPLVATEVINAVYFVLSHLVDQGSLNKDLGQLLDQLPPSIRAEISVPLRENLETLQVVAFAPAAAWSETILKDSMQKKMVEAFELLQKALRLSEEGLRA